MADKPDDLDAVRKLVEVLSAFDAGDQERIVRWAREKLGLPTEGLGHANSEKRRAKDPEDSGQGGSSGPKDIRTFVTDRTRLATISSRQRLLTTTGSSHPRPLGRSSLPQTISNRRAGSRAGTGYLGRPRH